MRTSLLMWQAAIKNLDVPQIRLHDARHTCATLMQVRGIASDASFGVVGDRELVMDFGFGASAGAAWRYGLTRPQCIKRTRQKP
jgi:hypothetical protein